MRPGGGARVVGGGGVGGGGGKYSFAVLLDRKIQLYSSTGAENTMYSSTGIEIPRKS